MRIIGIVGRTRGVGRTTTALNLAAAAARSGRSVLLIDADPAGGVLSALGLSETGQRCSSAVPNLDVWAAGDSGDWRAELGSNNSTYDLVVIDTAGEAGPALAHCDDVLIVARSRRSVERDVAAELAAVDSYPNPGALERVPRVLLTRTTRACGDEAADRRLREHLGGRVLPTVVPHDEAVARALLVGRALVDAEPEAPAAAAYRDVAESLGLLDQRPCVAAPTDNEIHIVPVVRDDVVERPAAASVPSSVRRRKSKAKVVDRDADVVNYIQTTLAAQVAPGRELDVPPPHTGVAEAVPAGDAGFQVQFDVLAEGLPWGSPSETYEGASSGPGFAVASTEPVQGPPVPPPVEVPRMPVTSPASQSITSDHEMPVPLGIDLNAPVAALIQPGRRSEAELIWGPTQGAEQSSAGVVEPPRSQPAVPVPTPAQVDMPPAIGHIGDVNAVGFSRSGDYFFTASWDKTVRVWETATGKEHGVLAGHTGVVSGLALSGDGALLATAGWDKTIRVWNLAELRESGCMSGHKGVVTAVAFSPDGKRLVSGSWDKTVRIWDVASATELLELAGHSRMVTSVAWSPDGSQIVSGGWDETIRLWDSAGGRLLHVLSGGGDVAALALAPGGDWLVSGSQDHTATIWDVVDGQVRATLRGHAAEVTTVAISPDGGTIATAGYDRTIRLWDRNGSALRTLRGHLGVVTSLSFQPDGRALLSVGLDRTARLWNPTTGEELHTWTIQIAGGGPMEVSPADIATPYLFLPVPQPVLPDTAVQARPADVEPTLETKRPPPPLPAKKLMARSGGEFQGLAIDNEGTLLAAAAMDGLILLWELWTGHDAGELEGHRGPTRGLAFSPTGRLLASAGQDGTVRLWDVSSAQPRHVFTSHEAAVTRVTFSPEGGLLASADEFGGIRLWDVTAASELAVLAGHTGAVTDLAFAPDGAMLASAGRDHTVRLWDLLTVSELAVLRGHGCEVLSAVFTPDGRTLASGSTDGMVRFWDVSTRQEWNALEAHPEPVVSLAFSPDGHSLATAADRVARLWDCITGQVVHELLGHTRPIAALTFAPDGLTLATAAADQTVRVWHVDTGKLRGILCQADDTITGDGTGFDAGLPGATRARPAAPISVANRLVLAAAASDGRIHLWDATEPATLAGEPAHQLAGHGLDVNGLAFAPDGAEIASASADMKVILWDVVTRRPAATLAGHTGEVTCVAYAPGGRLLASGGWDTIIKLWDLPGGTERGTLRGHHGAVTSLAFHPDGHLLASGGWDRTVALWDVGKMSAVGSFDGHDKKVTAVAFAPGGAMLATGSWDKTARIWDTASRQCKRILGGHRLAVSAVAWHPDGKRLATGSWDTSVRIWDLSTGRSVLTLAGHADSVRSVAFSPDGKTLASGSWDGTLRLWDARTGAELACLRLAGGKFHALAFHLRIE